MRVLISDDILADPAQWPDLESLLDRARRNRCYVDVVNPTASESNPWFDQVDLRRQQDWLNALSWAVNDAALYRLNTIVAACETNVSAQPHAKATLSELIDLVDQPSVLWVENDRNDRRFLLAMLTHEQRRMLRHWEDRRIVQINSRGGLGELRKALEDLIDRNSLDCRRNRALFDSDAEVPGHRSKDALAMVKFCVDSKIGHHCLTRRAIENYIPRKALWEWVLSVRGKSRRVRRKRIVALLSLSQPQRDHFRMKTGWDGAPSPQVLAHYANVPAATRLDLSSGIDNDIASTYATYEETMFEWAWNEGIDPDLQATINDLIDWIRVPYA